MDKQNVVFAHNGMLCSIKKEILSHATRWMKLEDVILMKEASQKDKRCMVSLPGGI
jgi:hypothetical protein